MHKQEMFVFIMCVADGECDVHSQSWLIETRSGTLTDVFEIEV